MTYAAESFAFDTEILAAVEAWRRSGKAIASGDFDDLALRLLEYQLRYNRSYARYCAGFGISPGALPSSWEAIPPVPTAAFKEATLTTFDPSNAALAFETSGTTAGTSGRHFMETRSLYDGVLLAGFEGALLADGVRLRYLNAVPNPAERPQSSLGYMMAVVSATFGDGQTGWYVRGDALLADAFLADAHAAIAEGAPVCLAATAFALAGLLDELERRGLAIALPPGSCVMETGGFKGRARVVERAELYDRTTQRLGIPLSRIVAEYGMTELTSQYYDAAGSRDAVDGRRKTGPPWLRTRVVGADGKTLPNGTVGALVHVDLANRSSCIAVATEDLGVQFDPSTGSGQGGLVLIGRDTGASLRGCSLDAETLLPR
jgi:hypothetical protein